MTEIKIYFNDLAETAQEKLWENLQKALVENGEVVPQGTNETEEEFLDRVWGQTEHQQFPTDVIFKRYKFLLT